MGYINIVLQCGSIQNHKIENNAFESEKKIIYCNEHYCMHCCNFLIAKKIKINATHIALTKDSQCYDFTIHRIRTVLSVAYYIARRIGSFCDEKKTYSILHVLFSNSSLFENEVFGEGDFIKNVCVRISLLVFPLFQTFFPYKFLNVFLRKVA